ncbi:Alpha/Beta hydrolase protein [Mycena floridula]|nr:Alpha/Beta hydrolase protein [Mycena floridula]
MHPLHYLVPLPLFGSALAVIASPRIQTSSGVYIGATDTVSQIDSFKGLRYAESPSRFSPAQYPTDKLETEQSAVDFGDDCPQFPTIPFNFVDIGPPLKGANQSEDCLYLNVSLTTSFQGYETHTFLPWIWRPSATSTEDSLPILVYIHRIGSLGFLGSVQLPIESLNLGQQDQRLALRWIQDNARSFGGDPERVTIWGESAGAASVHLHYLYPDSKKLSALEYPILELPLLSLFQLVISPDVAVEKDLLNASEIFHSSFVADIPDTFNGAQTDFFNSANVLAEFGRFG